ncbi:energy transducer TonB [Yoonia sp. SDW83-1]|uniref:energy transducer TonB n=1 Tax=Yoonia sp. SDW83-1 TaxID=3366945 RepID=UPI00398C30D8
MQTPGTIISAAGHTVLIGWLLLGWGLSSDPLEFDTMVVTTVSGEEFAALQAASTPDPGTAEPTAPVQPVTDTAPPPPADETPTEVAPPPEPVEQPVEDTPPPPPPPAPPVAEVDDVPPVDPAPPAPPPARPDLEISERPRPRVTDTIAPVPAAPPPPDAAPDEIARDEVVQDETADPEIVEDEQEATAPPEAETEIAIADETPSGAVETSIRPSARPSRPAPQVEEPVEEPTEEPLTAEAETPVEPETDDAVAAALADALAGAGETATPEAPAVAAGPPMTGSEKDAFRIAINNCWNIDPGSEAARVTVTVVFELGRDGKVVGNPRLISGSGGTDASINVAFEAARRAILRCQGSTGYRLPPEKFEEWREVTANFDASGARY